MNRRPSGKNHGQLTRASPRDWSRSMNAAGAQPAVEVLKTASPSTEANRISPAAPHVPDNPMPSGTHSIPRRQRSGDTGGTRTHATADPLGCLESQWVDPNYLVFVRAIRVEQPI
jgi:hypothetical protein